MKRQSPFLPAAWVVTGAAALALVATAAPVRAQGLAPPQNVVTLQASASIEVDKDWLTIAFSTSRDGTDAALIQSQLRQALELALAEARKAARPGQVEVKTGAFSLLPRYAPKGGINGWQGSTELIVQGRDIAAISQLAGRIQSLSIARVSFSLSREAREKVEADVTAEAIARFRAKAEAVSRQFGFSGYVLREAAVSSEGAQPVMAASYMRAAARVGADEALPVEAGKAVVTSSVNGSVQMR